MAKPSKRAQSAAAQQPVVHDDEPADADHGAPGQGEVIGEAEFAGEMWHADEFDPVRWSANYKAWRDCAEGRYAATPADRC